MQIVDVNDFNVRTAVYLLEKEQLEFLIIPVFHIGTNEFYQEVTTELDKCDVILFEGVQMKGFGSLWKAYKRLAKSLDLCYQGDELNMKKYRAKLVHADFASAKAQKEWKKVPFVGKFFFKKLLPFILNILSISLTRNEFAQSIKRGEEHNIQLEDGFWFMKYGKSNSVSNFIMKKRDQVLIDEIEKQIQHSAKEKKRIGIIYGAAHMEQAMDHLMTTHRFRLKDSWFLTVFWLVDEKFNFRRSEGG